MKAQPKDDPQMGEAPYDKEWWDSLDPEDRTALERAIAAADAGEEGIPHEEVMAEVFAKLDAMEAKRHR